MEVEKIKNRKLIYVGLFSIIISLNLVSYIVIFSITKTEKSSSQKIYTIQPKFYGKHSSKVGEIIQYVAILTFIITLLLSIFTINFNHSKTNVKKIRDYLIDEKDLNELRKISINDIKQNLNLSLSKNELFQILNYLSKNERIVTIIQGKIWLISELDLIQSIKITLKCISDLKEQIDYVKLLSIINQIEHEKNICTELGLEHYLTFYEELENEISNIVEIYRRKFLEFELKLGKRVDTLKQKRLQKMKKNLEQKEQILKTTSFGYEDSPSVNNRDREKGERILLCETEEENQLEDNFSSLFKSKKIVAELIEIINYLVYSSRKDSNQDN